MTATLVNTAKVAGRRQLRFHSYDDILADAEQLALAARLRQLGNWTPGQIFKHVAITMNGTIDGMNMRVPWFYRLMGRFFKRHILTKGMTPGFKLNQEVARVMVPPASITLEEGLQALRDAVRRLQTDPRRTDSPFLGPMTDDEWLQLHCRHSELHFSFLQPE